MYEDKYSFCNYRKGNIIEPITAEQEGFFYITEETKKQICELQRLIREDIYGCYLISGMRGVGKTSFINVALSSLNNKYTDKKPVLIRINATQMRKVEDLFGVMIREFIRVNNSQGDKEWEKLIKELEGIDKANRGELTLQEIKSCKGGECSGNTDIVTKQGVISMGEKILFFKPNVFLSGEDKKTSSVQEEKYTERTNQYQQKVNAYELFREWLNKFEECRYRLIVVIDEIDKCKISLMEEIFAQYKELLTNYKLFCFFVSDEKTMRRCMDTESDIYSTYFIKNFYLPLLSYEETMRYCYGYYCEEKISTVDIIYYLTIGNTRAINIKYKTHISFNFLNIADVVLLYKARLFRYILDNIKYVYDMEDSRMIKIDLLKRDVKKYIEYIFDNGGCKTFDIMSFYEKNKSNSYPSAQDILRYVKDYKDELGIQILNISAEEIHILYNENWYIYAQMNKLYFRYEDEDMIEYDNEINIEKLYSFFDKKYYHFSQGGGPIGVIKLGNNEPYAYGKAMEHLLISNIFSIGNVIWIKRVRDGGENWYMDKEYSVLIVLDMGIGKRYLYYNEAGSYSSEGSTHVEEFVNKLKKLNVKYTERTYDRGETIDYIIEQTKKELEE